MEEIKKTHGGARAGAGRHLQGTSRKVTVAMTISPEAKARMQEVAAARGTNLSLLLEELIWKLK